MAVEMKLKVTRPRATHVQSIEERASDELTLNLVVMAG